MEWVQLEPATPGRDGRIPRGIGDTSAGEPFERPGKVAAVRPPPPGVPLIEGLAGAECEPRHELPAIEGDGLVEVAETHRTGDGLGPVIVAADSREGRLEAPQVDVRVGAELDRPTVDDEADTTEGALQHRQRPSQRPPRVRVV